MPRRKVSDESRWRLAGRCAALLAFAAWAILLTGCGGDAGTSSAASGAKQDPLSNAALATKADAICQQLRGWLSAADAEAGFATLAQRAKLSVLYGEAEERASDRLAALQAQPSEEAEWRRIIATRRALRTHHQQITKYGLQGNAIELEAAYTSYKVAQTHMLEAFEHSRFGFKVCSTTG